RAGGDRLHLGGDPGLAQVGEQVRVERELVAGAVARDDAELVGAADEPGRLAPLDQRGEERGLVDAEPPEVWRADLGVVGDRGPLREQRRLALLGDAQLVVAGPAAD